MKLDIEGTVTIKRGKEHVNLSGKGVEVSKKEGDELLKLDCCTRSADLLTPETEDQDPDGGDTGPEGQDTGGEGQDPDGTEGQDPDGGDTGTEDTTAGN